MNRFTIRHTTVYLYHRPVALQRHRLMIRPRDSHDVRLIDAGLTITPRARVHWIHDVFANSIALVDFDGRRAHRLEISSELTLERFARRRSSFDVQPEARLYPFVYNSDDRIDLGRMTECHFESSVPILSAWLTPFVANRDVETFELLSNINADIRQTLRYEARYRHGTQSPRETLQLGSGTCRDFALLFVEAARVLGLGARFVTGYLYDPSVDRNGAATIRGAQATHAWAEIYVPGPGWVEFDPTNNLVDSPHLIRIATTRDPSQALPVSGSFVGDAGDFDRLEVHVEVAASAALESPRVTRAG